MDAAFGERVIFAVPFPLHSLAAQKADRFFRYAMPFFFAIWGFTEEMIEVLQASAQPMELPEEWRIHAYTWSHGDAVTEEAGCPVLEARRPPRL